MTKFDDLYNAVISEAPMSSFLNKLGRGAAGAAKVGLGAAKLGAGAAKLGAGAVKTVAKVPGAVKSAREFLIGQGGQQRYGDDPFGAIARGARQFQRGATRFQGKATKMQQKLSDYQQKLQNKDAQNVRSKMHTAAGPDVEEFDKDVVKALLASQGAVKQAGMTSSTTTQAPGTVTQGQVIASGMAGTTPPETSTAATTAKTTQSTLLKREPKAGDTFSLTDKFGKQKRYKVTKIENGKVSASPIGGSSVGV